MVSTVKIALNAMLSAAPARAQQCGRCGKKYAAVSLTAKRKQNERNGKRGTFLLHTHKYGEFFLKHFPTVFT